MYPRFSYAYKVEKDQNQLFKEVSMKWIVLTFGVIAMTLFFVSQLNAQPGLPSPPSQAPIDGGLSLLAAAGGGYALHKLRKMKKEEYDEQN